MKEQYKLDPQKEAIHYSTNKLCKHYLAESFIHAKLQRPEQQKV